MLTADQINQARQAIPTLKLAAHLTAAFMGSNVLSFYAGAADNDGTKVHIYTAISLAFCGYGIWQTLNQTGSNQPTSPTELVGCSPRSATETHSSGASPTVEDLPVTEDAVTQHPQATAAAFLSAASFPDQTSTQPGVADYLRTAFNLAERAVSLAVSNISTTAGTVTVIALAVLGVFA